MTASPPSASISGPQLREMFSAAVKWLEQHVAQVNAVNVFPVPDGDTGTNMFLTLRSTVQAAEQSDGESAGAVLAAMAHGALMGARGNSGVILSQIIRGIADSCRDADAFTPDSFAAALENGAAAAYQAVTKPTEGTILTVARESAAAARAAVAAGSAGMSAVMLAVAEEARRSVERTPSLLPVLAEAGVVDAGGLGLSIILEGMRRQLAGESVQAAAAAPLRAVGEDWLAMTEQRHAGGDSLYGYCTEALISGDSLDIVAARDHLLALGDSVLVVGDQRLMRVHVHTDDPGRVLSHGTSLGNLLQVKVDNIRKQAEGFVEMHEDRRAVAPDAAAFSSVAVVAGEGMAGVFASVGCTRTVSGGPTMNPSAQEILDAIEACPCWDVVVLPNDRNVVLAAEQAAALTDKRVRVVACRSMPEGLAALLAASPDEGLDANVDAMKEALSSVHTVEVTRAVRSTRMGGLEVRFGQAIGILDGELIVAAASPEEAAIQTVAAATGDDRSLITVYFGGDAGEDGATALAARLRERFSAYDVEVVYGGQPNYDYIISVE